MYNTLLLHSSSRSVYFTVIALFHDTLYAEPLKWNIYVGLSQITSTFSILCCHIAFFHMKSTLVGE